MLASTVQFSSYERPPPRHRRQTPPTPTQGNRRAVHRGTARTSRATTPTTTAGPATHTRRNQKTPLPPPATHTGNAGARDPDPSGPNSVPGTHHPRTDPFPPPPKEAVLGPTARRYGAE